MQKQVISNSCMPTGLPTPEQLVVFS